MDQAEVGGASDEQMAVLARVLAAGEMSFDEINSLVPAVLECIESAGIDVQLMSPVDVLPGVPLPQFRMSAPPGTSESAIEAAMLRSYECEREHWMFAQTFYVDQSASRESYDNALLEQRDEIRDCLAGRGIHIDPDATAEDIKWALVDDLEANSHEPGWDRCDVGGQILVIH